MVRSCSRPYLKGVSTRQLDRPRMACPQQAKRRSRLAVGPAGKDSAGAPHVAAIGPAGVRAVTAAGDVVAAPSVLRIERVGALTSV